ncbi:hypothetical protein [Alkaliphilus serpentinus]|uniref:PKD domain-containing protein n=1 Tax=Alkaliphilus serpentinus TaxID=1482731 RepID=A0A833M6D9_9FIRM|nr:hypothetical protein [Alkaliphilus serpentinus]KAB3527264.1 hypothetical protein F8153_12425 [Alkaliphilus serpentinus]
MDYIQLEKYHITDTFKKSEKQDIFIGNAKDDETNTVIINTIKDKSFIKLLNSMDLDELQNILLNLELIKGNGENVGEEGEEREEITLVTSLQSGTPMENYLEENDLSLKERMNLALEYMKEILKYKSLSPVLQSIFVDETQLVSDEGRILFDELLIIEDEAIENVDFNRVCRKVGNVLYKLIFSEGIYRDSNLITAELTDFIDCLRNNNHTLTSLDELMIEFRKHYIYYVCMEEMNKEDAVPSKTPLKDQRIIQYGGKNRKRRRLKYALPMAIILLIAFGVIYRLQGSPEVEGDDYIEPAAAAVTETEDAAKPIAEFELIKSEDQWRFINKSTTDGEDIVIEEYLWEISKGGTILQEIKTENITLKFKDPGIYKIDLLVRDSMNQWSDRYSMEVYISQESAEDPFNNYLDFKLSYDDRKVEIDDEKTRNEDISYKIIGVEPTTLSLKEIGYSSNGTLSFWLMANSTDTMTINLQGYYQDNLIITEDLNHKHQANGTWEMVKFQLVSRVDTVEITFEDYTHSLWVGDIALELYK